MRAVTLIYRMKRTLKRIGEEFYFYSSQLVLFFVVIIFLTSGSMPMGILFSGILGLFSLAQNALMVSYGHKPPLRLLYSMITPAAYTLLRAATGNLDFLETTNILLWGASVYIGGFQALSIAAPAGFLKRAAETMLALGAAVLFIVFYYYLDLRLNLAQAFGAGKLDPESYARALSLSAFPAQAPEFFRSSRNWFVAVGALSFDAMLLAARMRAITLRERIDRILAAGGPQAPGDLAQNIARKPRAQAAPDSGPVAPRRAPVTVVSSDIVAFTDMADRLGPEKAVELLNRYVALWTRMAEPRGGSVLSVTGDSVMLVFGLSEEADNPERGLSAALAFIGELPGLIEDLAAASLPSDLRVSIGVHSGMVVVANVGRPGERRIGAFGDAIAVAARLDSLCRELNQNLLVSHPTFRRLSLESQAGLDRIGEVLLRKSTRPVPVYGLK